ncbi:histidine phosphatase superfamily [Boletus edulis BED1]|uniref:Histidine phosphatase superfamily n=1 Tax=Boletus edulis BED1 TaxID=1328754 RepID=A0AAD4BXY2_BOLED|nr:histidine phosphatase superfamily [Boletus edulis BED1]
MLVVSFIRHGESLDNLKSIWAGHKDAELSELGVRAKALGESYTNTRLDAIITSDLKRAHATAVALLNDQADPKPSFKVDRDIREQCFGDAEGHPWMLSRISSKPLDDHFRDGQYPVLFERHEKFPDGESLDDVAVRAERFIRDHVLKPHLSRAISGVEDIHVAVVSHGLCISELVPALLKRSVGGSPAKDYRGLQNTAWTRVTVQPKVILGPLWLVRLTKRIQPGAQLPEINNENLPPLIVAVTDVNRHEHTANVKRQKGIVAHDPKQRGIRDFFGGGGAKKPVEAPEQSDE